MGSDQINARNSNLELLRIVLMLAVVAHHYVFASGIQEFYNLDLNGNLVNTIILQLLGAWGKAAINAYVLITGYFMCKSKLTWEKVVKLILEIKFYEIVMFFFLAGLGYNTISPVSIFKLIFSIGININHSFVASFVAFYLFIPFFNKTINAMTKSEYHRLLLLLIFIFTMVGTFLSNFEVFSHLSWYSVLYFIAAYFRLYPADWMKNIKFTRRGFWFSFLMVNLSIPSIGFLNSKLGTSVNCYYFVMNSHKLLALLTSVFIFLWFMNIKIRHSKIINTIASTTFGVLLIHTNSEAFSELLWVKIFKVPEVINWGPLMVILHCMFASAAVFGVCMVIDYLRIRVIEKPYMDYLKKNKAGIEGIFIKIKEKITGNINRLLKLLTNN